MASAATATENATAIRAGVGPAATIATMTRAKPTSTVLSARKTRRPMPSPICNVTLGARNFSGASRNEMASTMPSQTKVTATAIAGSGAHPARSAGVDVGQAQIRLDERVEPVDGDRRRPGLQGPCISPRCIGHTT